MLKDDSVIKTVEEDAENLGIFTVDPSLLPYKVHFTYRSERYTEQKALIEKHEGSLEEFSQGWNFYCFLLII